MNRKLIRSIPALWACIFDTTVTTLLQPSNYWEGNLEIANEGNPIGNFFMTAHISGLFVITAIWLGVIGVLGYYLPKKLAKIFLLFVLLSHSWGASTWLSMHFGFWSVMLFMIFNAFLYIMIDERGSKQKALNG